MTDPTPSLADRSPTLPDAWVIGQPGDWLSDRGRVTYPTRAHALELSLQLSRPVPGHIMEFGVFQGESARIIRDELWRMRRWDARAWRKRIYACDSFEGLPAGYEHLPAGNFATSTPRLTGLRVVQGFFDRSLTPELAAEVGRVSFAHLDADLYESTACVLDWLTPLLGPGSVLLFDELCGEDPAEARALTEWVERTGTRVAMLALLGREPSGAGDMADRRGLFQIVGDRPVRRPVPLLPVRVRRRLARRW